MSSPSERVRLLRAGTIKRIHVDQAKIRRGDPDPITVQTSAGPIKAAAVLIAGESEVVYDPGHPLSCGARVWIETRAEVEVQ